MVDSSEKNSYGKKPLWQWIVIYLIVGVVIYGAVYYLFLAKKGSYSSGNNQNSTQNNYNK